MPKSLLGLLRKHRFFFLGYLAFLILGYLIQLFVPKAELFLLTNKHHHESLDHLFKLITMMGDSSTMVMVGIGMLFVKYRYCVVTVLAYAYSAAIVQIVKRIFNEPRPSKFFEGLNPIRTLDEYPLYEWNSFPSGHSASAFTLAVVLTYILPYKHKHWVLLPFALTTAFSRVYLSQHFFTDIVAGSVVGVLLTFQLIWWLENSDWYHSDKLDHRLFARRRLPKQPDEPAAESVEI